MNLRIKVLLPLALFSAVFLAYLYGYWMPRSLANIEQGHRQSLERHLDSVDEALIPLLLGHQLDAVYENLDSLMKKNQDWIELRLLDAGGGMLYPLSLPETAKSVPAGKDVHVIERRIVYLEKDLGRLMLKVDFAPRLAQIRKRHWEMMSVTLAGIILFVVLMGFVLDRIVIRPVKQLTIASQRLAEDDFDVALQKSGEDEVGILIDDFSAMRTAIREYRGRLQSELSERMRAEGSLAERVMLAELSADIGYALTKQGELRNTLKACAATLVRHLDVAFARIWVLNAAENVLELQASAGMYTRIDGSHSRVPVGKFKIGLIAEERKPHITNAVIGDARVHDQEWAKREGMVAFAGHPLTIDDKLVGVMAMFSRNPLTDVTLKALVAVSNEIAVGIERKLSEETLHQLNRELRAISKCNQILMRTEDEQLLLNDVCHIVCDEAGYRMAWVGYAENDAAGTIRPVARAGAENGRLEQTGFTWADTERGRGPAGIAVRSGKSASIQDLASGPEEAPWRDSALQHGYRSCIALPLKDESGNAFGVLNIYSATPNAFTPSEIRLLEELAGDLAFGIIVLRNRIERQAHLRFFENMDRVNWAIQGTNDLEQMLSDVLGVVLSVFDCDRAYIVYPCDPEASSYRVPMERTKPAYPGALAKGIEVPVDAETIRVFRTVMGSDNPVTFGPGSEAPLPPDLTKFFGVQSQAAMAVYPKMDKPYMFGVHQCSYPRLWTPEETRLLKEIGRRLADALTSLLAYQESRKLNKELDQRVNQRTAELDEKNKELERFNKVFVNRELRMMELKEKIKELQQALGTRGK